MELSSDQKLLEILAQNVILNVYKFEKYLQFLF